MVMPESLLTFPPGSQGFERWPGTPLSGRRKRPSGDGTEPPLPPWRHEG